MELSTHSKNRLLETMSHWAVPKEFAGPMYNYLVYGYQPGGCFTSVLANDFARAITRSHPANTVEAFKSLVGWIQDHVPHQARGGYGAVDRWCNLSASERRTVLEEHDLIYTAKQETWLTLKEGPVREVMLY